MFITIRDLTNFYNPSYKGDKTISLPTDLTNVLKPNHEYMITDHDYTMRPDEYSDIKELNDFLYDCKNMYYVDDATLSLLSKTYTYEEVIAAVRNESFTILNFNKHTEQWCCNQGGDYSNPDDLGLCLFDAGYGHLPFEYKEEMEDYIKWEYVWTDAECRGWRKVITSDGTCYLIHNVW